METYIDRIERISDIADTIGEGIEYIKTSIDSCQYRSSETVLNTIVESIGCIKKATESMAVEVQIDELIQLTNKMIKEINALNNFFNQYDFSNAKKVINERIMNIYNEWIEKGIKRTLLRLKENLKFEGNPGHSLKNRDIQDFLDKRDFQGIIEYIQNLIRNREYAKVVLICEYWIDNIGSKTGIIYYFLGLAQNGLCNFSSSLNSHLKALELDRELADLKNKKSLYKRKYDEKIVPCIGCGNDIYEIVNVSNQSAAEDNKEIINPIRIWVKCKKCGLIYANPIPSEESINKYYSIIAKEKFGGIYGNIDNKFEFLVSMSNSRLKIIESHNRLGNSLLDIGAGVGIFVGTALDKGWKAVGLELTKEDCEYARECYGLELIQRDFYSFNEEEKYDVVTLFEVIEHLRNPFEDLKRINRLVKHQGILVVATPILDSLFGKRTKENNVFWYVVSHLSYFTKDVLTNYLEQSGFELVEINLSHEGMGRMEFYCRKIAEL